MCSIKKAQKTDSAEITDLDVLNLKTRCWTGCFGAQSPRSHAPRLSEHLRQAWSAADADRMSSTDKKKKKIKEKKKSTKRIIKE